MVTELSDWNDLANISDGKDYVLTNDIGPSSAGYDTYASSNANGGDGWDSLGLDNNTIDGNFYEIDGLYLDRAGNTVEGFSGFTGNSTIKNLGIVNVDMTADGQLAPFIGRAQDNCTVKRCWSSGTVESTYDDNFFARNGGIVGLDSTANSTNVVVENCLSTCEFTSENQVLRIGGIAGELNGGTVKDCYFSGSIETGGDRSGGIVGSLLSDSTINRCISYNVDINTNSSRSFGSDGIGGIAGLNIDTSTIKNCISASNNINNFSECGGISGAVENNAVIDNCYTINCDINGGYTGGIVGNIYDSVDVKNCESVGNNITGDTDQEVAGGLLASNFGGVLHDSSVSNNSISASSNLGGKYYGSNCSDCYNNTDNGNSINDYQGSGASSDFSLDFSNEFKTVDSSDAYATGDGYPFVDSSFGFIVAEQLDQQGVLASPTSAPTNVTLTEQ